MLQGNGTRNSLLAAAVVLAGAMTSLARADAPAAMPAFAVRVRIAPSAANPSRKHKVAVLGIAGTTTVDDGVFGPWIQVSAADVAHLATTGTNAPRKGAWPFVVFLEVSPSPAEVELETSTGGAVERGRASLFGPNLGLCAAPDGPQGSVVVRTMASYNERIWQQLDGLGIHATRPRLFNVIDRFTSASDDRIEWEEGIRNVARLGANVLAVPPTSAHRDALLAAGLHRTAGGAGYTPPGGYFPWDNAAATDAALGTWSAALEKKYADSGFAPKDVVLLSIADEPGWYYPTMLDALNASAQGLASFHDFLRAQHLTPADLGATRWDDVKAIGSGALGAKPGLASRRLFYWTTRFFPWSSSQQFARTTSALERQFGPHLATTINSNFFAGRSYVPGSVGNNPDRTGPSAAMGGHDGFELGAQKSASALWTEDWFADSLAFQWSFLATRMRSAARKNGQEFGGYLVGRAAGARPGGLAQKALALAGHGAKDLTYYTFGPSYNFPGNGYSDDLKALPEVARANTLLAKAEDVLFPGRAARAEVAILSPRSSQPWDRTARTIVDATNVHLNHSASAYTAEVADVFLALSHANVPCDVISEDEVEAGGLTGLKVLFVTEPNVPDETQRRIVRWVQQGGVVVTSPYAATRNSYDEPTALLATLGGIELIESERPVLLSAFAAKGSVAGAPGSFPAVVTREAIVLHAGTEVVGKFENGATAVTVRHEGKGAVVHFATFPGISYWASSDQSHTQGLPAGFSAGARGWLVWATSLGKISPPVTTSVPLVEAPVLTSSAGTGVTLLNWTGQPIASLDVTVRVPAGASRVESVEHGTLAFTRVGDRVHFSVPLGEVDVIKIR